jgi:hypothetical protein
MLGTREKRFLRDEFFGQGIIVAGEIKNCIVHLIKGDQDIRELGFGIWESGHWDIWLLVIACLAFFLIYQSPNPDILIL